MIPVTNISSGSLNALLYYVCLIGVLLVVSTVIRLKVPFLRKAFIPASLIAGLIGMVLGPHVLQVIPKDIMTSMSRIPSQMITVVFACMFLGSKKKQMNKAFVHTVAASVLWTWAASFIEFAIPCLLCALVFTSLNPLFGALFEVGFAGGHGTASGMASMFADPAILNWPDGADLAMTTATIGLLLGIFGGIILINYAVRRKYTKAISEVTMVDSKEVFAENEALASSRATISQDVVEPFAFHLGIIGIAILIGRGIVFGVGKLGYSGLPLFPFAMIGGWIINSIIQRTSLRDLLDRHTFQRLQGMALDILIVGAMASIKLPVILAYWQPLLLSSALIIVAIVLWIFWVCPHIFSDCWFELAIMHYGVKTGVAAVGYMLLRTVDPKMETEAGSFYALGTPFTSAFIGGGLVTSAIPYLILKIGALKAGLAFTGAFLAFFLILRIFFWDSNARAEQRA